MIITALAALGGLMLGYGLGVQRIREATEAAYKEGQLYGARYIQHELEAGRLVETWHGRAHREPAGISTPDSHQ